MSSYWRNKSEIVQELSTEKAMTKLTSPTSKKSTSHNVVILDSDAVPVLCVLFEHYIFILFADCCSNCRLEDWYRLVFSDI